MSDYKDPFDLPQEPEAKPEPEKKAKAKKPLAFNPEQANVQATTSDLISAALEWAEKQKLIYVSDSGTKHLKYDALLLLAKIKGYAIPYTSAQIAVLPDGRQVAYASGPATALDFVDPNEHPNVALATVQTMALARYFRQILGDDLIQLGFSPVPAVEMVSAKQPQPSIPYAPLPSSQAPPMSRMQAPTPAASNGNRFKPSGSNGAGKGFYSKGQGFATEKQQGMLFKLAKNAGALEDFKAELKSRGIADFPDIPFDAVQELRNLFTGE